MRRNVANQRITFEARLFDGSPVTSGITVVRILKDGVPSVGAGSITSIASGVWTYLFTQAETDCTSLGAVPLVAGGLCTVFTGFPVSYDETAADLGLNNVSTAEVNAEVDTALADYDGPTNAEMNARTILSTSYALETTNLDTNTVTKAVAYEKNTSNSFTVSLGSTGLSPTATVSKDGAAPVAFTGSFVDLGNNEYNVNGLAADWNGDRLVFRVTGGDDAVAEFKTYA